MSEEVKHQCCGWVSYGDWGRSRQCTKTGAYEHDGKHYCKTHHPPSVKERDKKRLDEWNAKWEEERKTNEQRYAANKEQQRKASEYDAMKAQRDELLAALKRVVRADDACVLRQEDIEHARAAIAKAEGTTP
jgi:uncharacterized Zn finger protein (UPF0148 family)